MQLVLHVFWFYISLRLLLSPKGYSAHFSAPSYLRPMLYGLLRRLLFTLSPEKAHHVTMNLIQESCNIGFLRQQLANRFQFQDTSLEKNLFGLRFPNPVGLGAGFDKNAKYLTELK